MVTTWELPVSEGRVSPRAECPPGHLALDRAIALLAVVMSDTTVSYCAV